jgi:regulator of ribonuclease activity A
MNHASISTRISTTDLCDEFSDSISIAEPIGFKDLGGRKSFYGKIQTVKVFENNPLVRKALAGEGTGKVLVVDGGGSMRCALLGDMMGELAMKNNWNGIIIYGCIRDSVALGKLDIGIKALNIHPVKSNKNVQGEENIPVHFAGVSFSPDDYVYCDEDGIVVSEKPLL